MICKFCGNSIEDNSDFCFICGQKVEAAEPAFQPAASNDVFSQAAEAPVAAPAAEAVAPVAPAAAPAAETPVAPAATPVYSPIPVEEPSKKKGKKQKDKSKASKALKFFTALFLAVFIGLAAFMWSSTSLVFVVLVVIYALFDRKAYKKAKSQGCEEKAVAILNSTGIGACIGMALVCLKFFMVAYM